MASRVLTSLNMDDEEDAVRKLLGYQAAARRAYNAAFKQLQVLQGDRFDRQPSSLPQAEQNNRGRSQSSSLHSAQHEITKRTRAPAATRATEPRL